MNRLRRRTNRKNHLNLPVRASTKAAREILPLVAGSQWLIQSGALLLLVFLNGCVSLERSYPDRRYFALELAQGKSPNSASDCSCSINTTSRNTQTGSFIWRVRAKCGDNVS